MRSLFRRKGRGNGNNAKDLDGDDTIPPMVAPIDPDGPGESHSSNENSSSSYSSADRASEAGPADSSDRYYVRNIPRKQIENAKNKSRDGVPIITSEDADVFSPSAVNSKTNYATGGFYSKSKQTFIGKERPRVRPSAKTSAFGGAPRYDWMDIVSGCGGS